MASPGFYFAFFAKLSTFFKPFSTKSWDFLQPSTQPTNFLTIKSPKYATAYKNFKLPCTVDSSIANDWPIRVEEDKNIADFLLTINIGQLTK